MEDGVTTDKQIIEKLSEPFPVDAIHWRVGATNKDKTKGIALAYVDARDVMDRLDDVVGCDAWQDLYVETPKGRMLCSLSLLINGEWITKSDGAGDTDVEGEKGGISDAFKRAAVKFGIARYLYRLDNVWCPIKQAGRSYKLASSPKLPSWAMPGGEQKVTKTEPKRPPEPEKPKFDPRARCEKWLDKLADLVGEEDAKVQFINLMKHSDYSENQLSLGGVRKFDNLRELGDEIKDMYQTTEKNRKKEEE